VELAQCGVGAEGCRRLAGWLARPGAMLQSLDLAKNTIGEAGAQALALALVG
ncbi:unnamed protein product, partial [Heterosigma akashiwo]